MLRRQRDEAELGDNDAAVGAEDEAVHARLSIDHLLALLPPKQAQAITLVKIEGASIAEASQICGQSESLVKVNIHRGLKKLAELIESERSEEHTSELQSLMRLSYAVFCLIKKQTQTLKLNTATRTYDHKSE